MSKKTEAIKEEKITYLVDTGFYTREEAEQEVQKLAGEDEKPKVTQKTEEAFKGKRRKKHFFHGAINFPQ